MQKGARSEAIRCKFRNLFKFVAGFNLDLAIIKSQKSQKKPSFKPSVQLY
jgi:hypothetical protein